MSLRASWLVLRQLEHGDLRWRERVPAFPLPGRGQVHDADRLSTQRALPPNARRHSMQHVCGGGENGPAYLAGLRVVNIAAADPPASWCPAGDTTTHRRRAGRAGRARRARCRARQPMIAPCSNRDTKPLRVSKGWLGDAGEMRVQR
eukprot:scaffold80102_cov69-Phaeocystis_antarctica.AAC.3